MNETRDMDAPVTRRELHEALEIWGGALEQRLEQRIEQRIIIAVKALLEAQEARLVEELRAQARGSVDRLSDRIGAIDDKYQDLPPRVARLEAKVFAPTRRKLRPAAQPKRKRRS
jgi:hypothetical protein